MKAFETAAVIEDASHLTLREPMPAAGVRECRVIVLFETENGGGSGWPAGFFEDIKINDPTFVRPAQGTPPPIRALDA